MKEGKERRLLMKEKNNGRIEKVLKEKKIENRGLR